MLGSQRMALNLASLTPKAKLFTRPQAVEVEVEREALGTRGPGVTHLSGGGAW